ncbi:hypothetical protein AVEN_211358-1 [Araneus ventricosus]|uniref:Uncharacterized protein n=1 Tax=Araneus ventricosus TaxID=182803 RepID=A0A4Y2H9S2_ARAVE|nr:hypothetical protein AVEN_211358-1 [Araneus ventricosus]
MNNHPGYPSPGFPPYGQRHPIPSDLPIHGPQRLPNHDVQEFSRNERLGPYPNSFRKETSLGYNDLSSFESRQAFSNEDMNSYRHVPRQYRHSRDNIFSGGRLSQIDQRTLLQSAPRTGFLNESASHSYSGMNKLDPKANSFSHLKQNQATSKFKSELYSNISRNAFSKEDVPYDNLSSSSALSNMQKFERDFSYQNEQTFSESRSHFSNILSSPFYSKNASFTNSRTFSEEHSPDTGFSRDSLSSGMNSYFKNHNFKQHDVHEQVVEIQRVLEEQRRLREDERVSLPTSTMASSEPTNAESNSLNNLPPTSNSFSNQILLEQLNWYQNTMNMKEQSGTPNKTEMSYLDSSQPSDNVFHGEFPAYSQPSVNKTLEMHDSKILNFRESEHWNNSLEPQNTCVTPEKMTIVQDSSHKMSSDFTDRKLNETIETTTIVETMSGMPITSVDNAIPLKVDEVHNFDKFTTKEDICENSQNYSNENLLPNNGLSKASNIETNTSSFGESFNNNTLDKQLEPSASYLTIPHENLLASEWTGFKSSEDLLNTNPESKNYSPNLDKSVPTNELQNSENLCLENSLNKHHETNKEHSSITNEKLSSTEWPASVSISLEDNLNKCLEIMKNYSPILIKNDGLKGESLSTENNSNECPGKTQKISPKPVENISSNESSMSAPIPFLNEANDPQSVSSNINFSAIDDLSQEPVSSDTPSFNSVITSSREISINGSALEHALATLEVNSPVVGLDYIVEDKNSLSTEGRFPFKCKLCNSSIARTLILDHIQGSKHRLRYLKIKDEASYDRIMRQKDQYSDKDVLICEAAAEMERKFGRGHVVVSLASPFQGVKKVPAMNIHKVCHDLADVDFQSTHKPDVKDLKTDSVVKNKHEEPVTSTLPESVTKVENDDSSMNVVISSCSASLPEQNFDDGKKGLKNIVLGISEKATSAEEITEGFKIDKPSDSKCENSAYAQKQINQLADSPSTERYPSGNLAFKRSSSPYADEASKNSKRQHVDNPNMDWNTSTDFSIHSNPEPLSNKDSSRAQTTKSNKFNPLILEQLSKCDISSEAEAGIILKTVDVLLKLLLRYKLKDHSNIDVENLTQSLHNKRPEEIFKLLSCLKENMSAAITIKEETPTVLSKDDSNSQSDIPSKSTLVSENIAVKRHQIDNRNLSQNNSTVSNTRTLESSNQLAESSKSGVTGSLKNASQPSNSHLLQPPPFFCWPTSSNAATTHGHSSVTTSQTVPSDMTWSSAYQANVAYYQQHGFAVPAMYQPYGIPLVPSIPSASVPLVAQVPPVVPPAIVAPLPPLQQGAPPLPAASSGTCVPLLPPPLPPPPPPSEPPPLPK